MNQPAPQPQAASPRRLDDFIGRTLDGRWTLESVLGQGGMGAVLRARQLSVDRAVAVKLILPSVAPDAVMVARFFREGKVLSRLQHPNIVKLLDFGQDADTKALYLVMELVHGQSLAAKLKARVGPLPLDTILSLSQQLLSALAAAHAQGIIHRDLKPENLIVTDDPAEGLRLTLLDFGIARQDPDRSTDAIGALTATGHLHGTPRYMAPEQVRHKALTPRTDLYAVGLLMYKLLANEEAFAGESMFDLLIKQVNETPPPLRDRWAVDAPLHEGLVALVHAMIAKDPDARPPDALDVLDTIKRFRLELHSGALSGSASALRRSQPMSKVARDRHAQTVLEAPPELQTPAHLPAPPLKTAAEAPPTRAPEWLDATRAMPADDLDLGLGPAPGQPTARTLLGVVLGLTLLGGLIGLGVLWIADPGGSGAAPPAEVKAKEDPAPPPAAATPAPTPPAPAAAQAPPGETPPGEAAPEPPEAAPDPTPAAAAATPKPSPSGDRGAKPSRGAKPQATPPAKKPSKRLNAILETMESP